MSRDFPSAPMIDNNQPRGAEFVGYRGDYSGGRFDQSGGFPAKYSNWRAHALPGEFDLLSV